MSAEPILLNLMDALTDLLKPKPAAYGTTALRILGKLGGKNREYLLRPKETLNVTEATSSSAANGVDTQVLDDSENGMTIKFQWDPKDQAPEQN